MDDEALLDRARGGDRDAFTVLVTRHQDELYNMALRLLGRPADAADVVQETFLRAYVRLPQLRGPSIRPWLYRVALNAAHDVQRRGARRPTQPLENSDGGAIDIVDPAVGPEGRAEAGERVAVIRDALLGLTPDFRAIVVLRDVNDLSYEEIAETLRIPIGTVRSRLSRARKLLTAALRRSVVLFPVAGAEG